jgi:histidyl-tRNA synthetase
MPHFDTLPTMTITTPRGTQDILPNDMTFWHHIENTSRAIFNLYHYQEIRTPIFESADLFERGLGDETDIVSKEMYTFEDKGNRRLTLRPEGTAPIVRAVIQHPELIKHNQGKLYYCGPMFRYERPQAGRYRQFHQIGVENIGHAHPFTDAEVISLGLHLFDELGLPSLSVNLNSVGCPVCRPVIQERLKQFLGNTLKHLCGDCNRRYDQNPLRILDCKNTSCTPFFTGLPNIHKSLCHDCKDHFNSVVEYLDSLGIPFNIDMKLVRGLDYYSKTTFEIISDKLGAQNALCGGGRYDNFIHKMGGKPTPAVGFAFGVERAVMVLKEFSDIVKREDPLIYVAPIGFNQQTKCFNLMNDLRRAGLKCEMDYSKEDLKSQLKEANKMDAKYCLILGEEESEKDEIILKDMTARTQESIPLGQIVAVLSQKIA